MIKYKIKHNKILLIFICVSDEARRHDGGLPEGPDHNPFISLI